MRLFMALQHKGQAMAIIFVMNMRQADAAPSRDITAALWPALAPASLLMTLAACLLGMAAAASCGCGFDATLAAVTAALAVTAHAAANLLGAHVELDPPGAGAGLTPAQAAAARPWALSALLVLLLAGLWLAARSGGALLGIGALGLLLVWAYLAPPLRLGQRSGGSEAVALLVGFLLVVGADFAQRRQWFVIPASMGLGVGLLAACVPLVRGLLPGRPHALAQRLGQAMTAALYAWLLVLAHGWLALSVFLLIPPRVALWGLVSLPLSLLALGLLWPDAGRFSAAKARSALWLSVSAMLAHTLALALALGTWASGR